jgi:hypothetical protein
MRQQLAAAALLSLTAGTVLANDTTAELGTGGLIFTRSDAVEMQSEDLFISREQVRVAYKFLNTTDTDVESVVAFPMPDIEASPYANVAIPQSQDNFLDFTVTVDGNAISPELDQRAFAGEVDVTDELRGAGIPLFPYDEQADRLIGAKSAAVRTDWIARGIIVIQTYDAGEGMKDHFTPAWDLKSTYWWRMKFPKGRQIDVRHSYKPSVGGTVSTAFVDDGKVGGPMLEMYRDRYCVNRDLEKTIQKAADANDGFPPYTESWISYVLTTGGNWRGSIGKFKLTIDKGEPNALVSFCGKNVRKTGSTTFEMTADDFYPEKDLHILILSKMPDEQ